MVVELNRDDLATLLAGTDVPDIDELINEILGKRLGWYDNNVVWDRLGIIESDLTDKEIFDLYKRIIDIWNN